MIVDDMTLQRFRCFLSMVNSVAAK